MVLFVEFWHHLGYSTLFLWFYPVLLIHQLFAKYIKSDLVALRITL